MTKDVSRAAGERPHAAVATDAEESLPADPAAAPAGEVADPAGEPLRWRERLSYGVGDIGANMIFVPITTFLMFYLTEIVGIGAAIAGTLLLLGRLMDGTLDLIIGTLIDKTSSRWGKARPWLLVSAPFVVVAFLLLFNVPDGLDMRGKEIYAFVFYFLCLGVGFVASNLAYHTLLSVITSNSRMRVSLTVIRTACALVSGLVVSTITIPVVASFGGGQQGWTVTVFIYGGIAIVTLLAVFFGTKERVRPVREEKSSSRPPVRRLIVIVFRNPFFLLGFAFFFSVYLLSGASSAGVYYASDVLGDSRLFGFLSMAQLAPIIVGIWFMPRVIARFGKRVPILIGVVVILIGAGITFIDPTSLSLIVAGTLLKGIGGIPAMAAMFALIADIVDYGEWKSGVRVDGMTYGAATAGQNFGAGLGAALVGWVLAAGHYQAGSTSQPASAIGAEVFLYLGLPVIVALAQGVIIFFLNIDKHMPVMQRDLAARRTNAEQTKDHT